MMLHSLLTGAAMMALTIGAAQAQDADPKHRQFLYFLQKGNAGAVVKQRIDYCPINRGDEPRIITTVMVGAEMAPDTSLPLSMDARSGFLSKRSTKLALHADGTLASFDASSEGQGGPILATAIKTAATVASWGAGPLAGAAATALALEGEANSQALELHARGARRTPARRTPLVKQPVRLAIECTQEITTALARLKKVQADITSAEDALVAGGVPGSETARLVELRTEQQGLLAALSLSAGEGAEFTPRRTDFAVGIDKKRVSTITTTLPPVETERWFVTRTSGKSATRAEVTDAFPNLPGRHGFLVTLAPDLDLLDVFAGDGSVATTQPTRAVYYRRAVPAVIKVVPCAALPVTNTTCSTDPTSPSAKVISRSTTALLPQLSGLYSLSIGSGGLFGTREASLKLDDNGVPLAWEYGSASGGADIASVGDSALSGATTLRDASLTATKRRAEEISAENDLAALLAKK